MRPAQPNKSAELLASIESTLSEIEKSGIPELSAGPDAFDAWIRQPQAVEVGWGWMKTAIRDEVIFTQNLSDCSAIVLCTNYDEQSDTVGQRSLMHILGSCLDDSDGIMQSLELIRQASESSGKPRCIIALGSSVAMDQFATIANQDVPRRDGQTCKPFRELERLCNVVILDRNHAIAVRPDGAYVVVRDDHHG